MGGAAAGMGGGGGVEVEHERTNGGSGGGGATPPPMECPACISGGGDLGGGDLGGERETLEAVGEMVGDVAGTPGACAAACISGGGDLGGEAADERDEGDGGSETSRQVCRLETRVESERTMSPGRSPARCAAEPRVTRCTKASDSPSQSTTKVAPKGA